MTERRIGIRDIPVAAFGKISAEVLMHGLTPEIIDPEKNLEVARQHLKERPGILLFNHAKNDFGMWARVIEENLASLDNTRALVAMKYLDPKRGRGSKAFSFFLSTWKVSPGVGAIPLVQKKDNDFYPNHMRINGKSLVEARNFLNQNGRIVAFSPEGTRSLTGELGRAEENSEAILRLNENAVIIPVAAEFPIDAKMKLYKSKPIKIHVGKPFLNNDINEEQIKNPDIEKRDLIMQRIAILLPEASRGYYK